jgi:hypothetical protein
VKWIKRLAFARPTSTLGALSLGRQGAFCRAVAFLDA